MNNIDFILFFKEKKLNYDNDFKMVWKRIRFCDFKTN